MRAYTLIKAYATKSHMHDTPVITSKEFWVQPHAPEFSHNGGTFEGQAVVEISSQTPDSLLRCTDDGSEPDLSTPAHPNPTQLTIVKTGTVLKCITTAHKRAISKLSTSGTFRIKSYPPVFHPNGGAIEDYVDATITTLAGAASTIFYHYVDSLHPERSDKIKYAGGVTVGVTGTVITAVAAEQGKLPSDTVVSNKFQVSCAPVEFYAAGEWAPGHNQTSELQTFVDKAWVIIGSRTDGASIKWKTNKMGVFVKDLEVNHDCCYYGILLACCVIVNKCQLLLLAVRGTP